MTADILHFVEVTKHPIYTAYDRRFQIETRRPAVWEVLLPNEQPLFFPKHTASHVPRSHLSHALRDEQTKLWL